MVYQGVTPLQKAEAFSHHRFDEAYEYLDPAVRWVMPGEMVLEGSAAVVAACEDTTTGLAELASVETERSVSVGDDEVAAVDTVTRYVGRDGGVSVVSSADVYEFNGAGLIVRITSYTVEIPQADSFRARAVGTPTV